MAINTFNVPMAQITSAVYNKFSKSKQVIARRPCGFITETTWQDKTVRRMFVEADGVYYSGIMLPWESVENFMDYEFQGVDVVVKAVFRRMQEAA